MADNLIVPENFYEKVEEEGTKKLKSSNFTGKARPLFRKFREYSYEPERCKDCEKLKLAKKEGIDYELIGWRLESPVGLFVLEGCNLGLYCPNKRRTFVIKCIPLNLKEIEYAIDILEFWLDGVTFEESEEEKIDEEKVRKAKEVMRILLLFNHQDRAEKVLESYPFPEHFNDIFEAFAEVCPYGKLGFPYRGIVKCSRKEDKLLECPGEDKEPIRSVEELYSLFFIDPEDAYDLCYLELRGNIRGFKFCYCITKKCTSLRATSTLGYYANIYELGDNVANAMLFYDAFKGDTQYDLARELLHDIFLDVRNKRDVKHYRKKIAFLEYLCK